jgi:hypothetical protein
MNRINVLTVFTLIFFFLLNHFIFTTFQIKSYNDIAFIDHDLGYLVEQLILKLDFFEISRIVSHPAVYGVEFYYLSYLFNFSKNFFNLSAINIFYLVTIFHLICVFITFYIIFKFFKKLNLNIFYFLFFFLTIISSPLYISNISHFKPDANLFILFIVSTIFFFNNYLKKNKIKYLLYSIIFSALAFSVKFFSLFFLFSFLYYFVIAKKCKIILAQIYLNIISLLNVIFITTWSYFFFDFLQEGYLDNLIKKKLLSENLLNVMNFFLHYRFFFLILFFLLAIIYIFFYKHKNFYVKNFFFLLNIFTFFSFLISIPLIFDYKTLFSSIVGFYDYTNLKKEASEFLFFSNFINFLISDFKYGIINVVSIFIIILSIILHFYKKIILPKIYTFISIYFFSMIFIMPLIWPADRLYLIRIVIFYLQFILFFLSLSIITKTFKFSLLNQYFLILLSVIYFIFSQNFNNVNLFKLYSNYSHIQNQVKDLNIKLNKYQNGKNKFYFCGGFFPYYVTNNYFEVLNSNCLNNNFIKGISNDDYLIITFDHIYAADLLLYEKLVNDGIIYNFATINGSKTRINGLIREVSYTVIKKTMIN